MNVLILTPSLTQHDAVSNEVVLQHKLLSAKGLGVSLYAEKVKSFSHGALCTRGKAVALLQDPACLVIYHHSTGWQEGEILLAQVQGKLVIRYHGITPAEFFPHEPATQREIQQGNEQTRRLAEHHRLQLVICNSHFIQQEWPSGGMGKYPVEVLAPFHSLEAFPSLAFQKIEDEIHVLFVGRFTPHKGQSNLLRLMIRYRERYGSLFHLHLVGKGSGKKTFLYALYQEIFANSLSAHVHIHYDVEAKILASLYQRSHFFISFSEHEGFGLPLLEAQYHGLAVLALYRGAVKEALGAAALGGETLDLDRFCAAIRILSTHQKMREEVVQAGHKNFEIYKMKRLQEKFLALLGVNDDNARQ